MSASIEVNCENSSTRRPSSKSWGNNSINRSSLADPTFACCAAFSFSSRGSQHAWRSFSSASPVGW